MDARENGAELLDELELELAKKLGREDHSSHKYFVVMEAMTFMLMSNLAPSDFGV
jgi:hypothetical protein